MPRNFPEKYKSKLETLKRAIILLKTIDFVVNFVKIKTAIKF